MGHRRVEVDAPPVSVPDRSESQGSETRTQLVLYGRTSIERTAYLRFQRLITVHELHLFFAPMREEAAGSPNWAPPGAGRGPRWRPLPGRCGRTWRTRIRNRTRTGVVRLLGQSQHHYNRLNTLAQAYSQPGTGLTGDSGLRDDILTGLDHPFRL
jgi:hypothetical protein